MKSYTPQGPKDSSRLFNLKKKECFENYLKIISSSSELFFAFWLEQFKRQ